MEIAQIKDTLNTQPFRAFTMHLVDGREFFVPHPEFVYIPPGRRFPTSDGPMRLIPGSVRDR
jgi:hypothetical protein